MGPQQGILGIRFGMGVLGVLEQTAGIEFWSMKGILILQLLT